VFSWTDDWTVGGHPVEDWAFGLTERNRKPRGATILKDAPNSDGAVQFQQLLLGPTGHDAFRATGPAPLVPAVVSHRDLEKLPAPLRPLVTTGEVFEGQAHDRR
jgi:hypothetical protein